MLNIDIEINSVKQEREACVIYDIKSLKIEIILENYLQ